MFTPNKAAEAILRGQFDEARQYLDNGETLTGTYVEHNRSQLFSSILRGRAFDLAERFIDAGLIETDVYEYENFDRSFFRNIAMDLRDDEVSLEFLRAFMEKISNKNDEVKDRTLLGYVLEQGAGPAIISALIETGCNVNYRNNADRNLIHQVVSRNMLPEEKGVAYLEILSREGVDISQKDIMGETPLLMAVKNNKEAYIAWLLQQGADPSEQDNQGRTAFYIAAAELFDPALFRMLCAYGMPDPELRTAEGITVINELMRIMQGSNNEMELLQLVLESGASLSQSSSYYGTSKSGIDWLAEKPSAVLQYVLKAHFIDVNEQDASGNTILHKVCGYNVNFDAETARDLYKKAKMLLEAGADPSITNDRDEIPQQLAEQDNLKIKTVELLLGRK